MMVVWPLSYFCTHESNHGFSAAAPRDRYASVVVGAGSEYVGCVAVGGMVGVCVRRGVGGELCVNA
jgi:hypothetical protein